MSKKGKLLILIVVILIISCVFGLIAIKKLNNANKSDNGVLSSNQSNGGKNTAANQGNGQESSENQENSANTINCPQCGGTGSITCPTCRGHGLYYICSECQAKTYTYLNTCPRCGSRNTLIQHVCPTRITCPQCSGSGRIPA